MSLCLIEPCLQHLLYLFTVSKLLHPGFYMFMQITQDGVNVALMGPFFVIESWLIHYPSLKLK